MKNTVKHPVLSLLTFVVSTACIADNHPDPDSAAVDTHDEVRFYRNPEERREAGFGTPIADGLTVSGLFEVEKIYRDDQLSNGQSTDQDEARSHTLQLGLHAEFTESLSAVLVAEAEYQNRLETRFEEALLVFDMDDWGIELGYQDLPFGEYYSHFITGPLLEFSETTATTFVTEYSIYDFIDVFGYLFDTKTRKAGEDSEPGWGLGAEMTNFDESIRIGAGYLSNLAESNEEFLSDTNQTYSSRVPAWNLYALLGFDQFELTAEVISATKSFAEFDSSENRPSAYNLELAWFINHSTQIAFRVENSRELAEQPEWQYGIAITWRLNKNLSISAEYLTADYKSDFAFDDDDQEIESHDQYGLQLGFEF